MSTLENKKLVEKYFKALSGKPKPESVLDLYTSDQPLKEHIAAAEISFPSYGLEPLEMIAEGDLVAVRARLFGSNTGPMGNIPPTGKSFDLEFFITYRIANGKIVDHWMVMDNALLMQQLGLMPAPVS